MNFLKKIQEFSSAISLDPFVSRHPLPQPDLKEWGNSFDSLPQHVCVSLDISDSMNLRDFSPTRLEATKKAACEFITAIVRNSPSTKISIISFNGVSEIVHPAAHAAESEYSLKQAVLGLRASGSTNIAAAFHRSTTEFIGSATPPDKTRILLLTDGEHNGLFDPLKEASKMKKWGTQLDIIGIGSSVCFDENKLKAMASVKNGKLRYWFITSTEGLVEKFQTLAIR